MSHESTQIHVNFVDTEQEKKTRRHTYLLVGIFTALVAIAAAIGASASYRAATHGTTIFSEIQNIGVVADVRQLFGLPTGEITATTSTRMNFLLLGIGGEGHDGPQLTDSILLATIDKPNDRIGLLSIPRDLAYPLGEGKFEKINAVNAYAEQDHPGEGAVRTADAIGQLLNVKIDHVIRVDFNGFASFMNAIDGIDVNVDHAFTDTQYPTSDIGPNPNEWMTVTFTKGMQHMTGARALEFVRSRHGDNGEGSDFARSHRQQLVTAAIRSKLLSLGTLSDPRKLAALYATITQHVQTDLTPWEILKLAPLFANISWNNTVTHVLTDAPDGALTAANVNGAYMLFPRKQDWSEIRDLAQEPFATSTNPTPLAKRPPQDITHIEIKNGTTRTGFAAQIAAQLEKDGYEITAFGNAVRRGYERTVIFDLTGGKKPAELANLRKILSATVSENIPSWIASGTNASSSRIVLSDGLAPERILSSNSDFLVILGEASAGLVNP